MLFYPKKGITLVDWIFSPDGSGISCKIKQGNSRRFIAGIQRTAGKSSKK
jgi:hypothetical protein